MPTGIQLNFYDDNEKVISINMSFFEIGRRCHENFGPVYLFESSVQIFVQVDFRGPEHSLWLLFNVTRNNIQKQWARPVFIFNQLRKEPTCCLPCGNNIIKVHAFYRYDEDENNRMNNKPYQ